MSNGTVNTIVDRFAALFASKHFLLLALVLTILTHLSMTGAGFFADDLIQRPLFLGNDALFEKGFKLADPNSSTLQKITNQFNFFNQNDATYQHAKDYGTIPWWTDPDAHLHLFRPISSLSHSIDYLLWPNNPFIMLLHNLAIYALAIFCLFRFYRSFQLSGAVVGLAIVLSILDISSYFAVGWIAARNSLLSLLLSIICLHQLHLYFLHQSRVQLASFSAPLQFLSSNKNLIFSLTFFTMALLAAEGGLAAFGFIVSYLIFYNTENLKRNALVLVAFILVIAAWRVAYNLNDYGSQNVGQYIDPIHSPAEFLRHIVGQAPLLAFELYTGLDGIDVILAKDKVAVIKPMTTFFVALFALALIPLLKRDKVVRFFFIGSLFTLVPSSALALTDGRVLLIPAIGASVVVALFLRYWVRELREIWQFKYARWLVHSMGAYFIGVSILLTLLISLMGTMIAPSTLAKSERPLNFFYKLPNPTELENKHLVIFNAPSPFMMMYLPYHLAALNHPLPESIRVLAPAFTEITIEPEGLRNFTLHSSQGMVLSSSDWIEGEKNSGWTHDAYRARNMQNFFGNNSYDFQPGKEFSFDELSLDIESIDEKGRPQTIHVELKEENLQDYLFYTWSWQEMAFSEVSLNDLNKPLVLSAPFIQN